MTVRSTMYGLALIGLLIPRDAWADDPSTISNQINKSLEKKIEAIRENLERQVVRSEDDERRAASLLEEVRTLDKQLLKAGRRSEELRAEEERLESEYRALSSKLEQLNEERARRRAVLVQRLTSLYKRGRVGSARAMLQAAASAEPVRMARYLAAINQSDSTAVRAYERARSEHETALQEMKRRRTQSTATRMELERANATYEKTRESKVALLARLEAELTARKIEMRRLKDAEDELRKILAEAPTEPRAPARLVSRGGADSGRGLAFADRRGTLAPPLSGRLLRRFGEADDLGVKAKGIIIKPDRDGRVLAVADGEVVFAAPFPGLGNTIIVNHGQRYHSVYAQLDRISAEVGSFLHSGSPVGLVKSEWGSLHFELRAEGKAVDPLAWIERGGDAFRR